MAEAEAAQPPGPAEPAGAEVVPLAGSSLPTGAPPRFVPIATAAPAGDLVADCGRARALVEWDHALFASMEGNEPDGDPRWGELEQADTAVNAAMEDLKGRPSRTPRDLAAKASVVLAGLGDSSDDWETRVPPYLGLVQSTMADAVRLCEPGPVAVGESGDVVAAAERVAALARQELAALDRYGDVEECAESEPDPRNLSAARAASRLLKRRSARLRAACVALAARPSCDPAAVAAKARAVLAIQHATEADPWWVALRDAVVREAAALAAAPVSIPSAAQGSTPSDPFVHHHREIMDIQAEIEVTPEDEDDALWARWGEVERQALASTPTTPAGAVGALEYARRELHQFKIELWKDSHQTDLLILHLLDGALAVLRGGVLRAGAAADAAEVAALATAWVRTAAADRRAEAIINDMPPRAPGFGAAFDASAGAARADLAMLRRIADRRSGSADMLALKAAAVLVNCHGAHRLDARIAEGGGIELAEVEMAVLLSLARDVIDHLGAPVLRLVAAVEAAAAAPVAGEAAPAELARTAA